MRIRLYFSDAWVNLNAYKLRSLLALLGIFIGTAAVVALLFIAQGAVQAALGELRSLGTRLLAVHLTVKHGVTDEENPQITWQDLSRFNSVAKEVDTFAPYTYAYLPLSYGGHSLKNGYILGATQDLQSLVKIRMASGRFISSFDKNQHFCTIGYKLAQELKQLGVMNPINQQVELGRHLYTIVGVTKPWKDNLFIYAGINNAVIVPIAQMTDLNKHASIFHIMMKLAEADNVDRIQQEFSQVMAVQFPDLKADYKSAEQLIEGMKKQSQTFHRLLIAIASISLLVGGIGVMNIMLVSVTERRREIGIRMAVGATGQQIRALFLSESVLLGMAGGVFGVIFGIMVAFFVVKMMQWPFIFSLLAVGLGLGVSVLVGLFFGLFPAIKAANVSPIIALRSE